MRFISSCPIRRQNSGPCARSSVGGRPVIMIQCQPCVRTGWRSCGYSAGRTKAPSAETRRAIASLITMGRPFTLAYYSRAEQGIPLFETGADGARIGTRYASGYFRMIRDFARDGGLHGRYGDAELTTAPQGPRGARPSGSPLAAPSPHYRARQGSRPRLRRRGSPVRRCVSRHSRTSWPGSFMPTTSAGRW